MNLNWYVSEGKTKSSTIVVTSPDNKKKVTFSNVVWRQSVNSHGTEIFNPINKYLETLPKDIQWSIYGVYEEVFNELANNLDVINDLNAIQERMRNAFTVILSLLDYPRMCEWLKQADLLAYELGIKDTLTTIDTAETTYLTEEYADLLHFSTMLKMAMPFWGWFIEVANKVLKPYDARTRAQTIIFNDEVLNLEAYKKLGVFISTNLAKNKLDKSFNLNMDFSYEDLPGWIVNNVLLKKLSLYNTGRSHKEVSVASVVYHEIARIRNEVEKNKARSKDGMNEAGEEMAISDMYKVHQTVEAYAGMVADRYIKLKGINPGNEFPEVNNSMEPMNYKTIILKAIFKNEIRVKIMDMVIIDSIVALTYAGGCWLRDNNLPGLTKLLTEEGKLVDINEISRTVTQGKRFNVLSKPTIAKLKVLYPHMKEKGKDGKLTQGELFIRTVIDELEVSGRDFGEPVFQNLREELAQLLFLINE